MLLWNFRAHLIFPNFQFWTFGASNFQDKKFFSYTYILGRYLIFAHFVFMIFSKLTQFEKNHGKWKYHVLQHLKNERSFRKFWKVLETNIALLCFYTVFFFNLEDFFLGISTVNLCSLFTFHTYFSFGVTKNIFISNRLVSSELGNSGFIFLQKRKSAS